MRFIFLFIFGSCLWNISAQDISYQAIFIDPKLTDKANAVIRDEMIEVEILSVDKMIIRTKRVVTVLNEKGENSMQAVDVYDPHRKIKKQQALIYDKMGKEIKKVKKKNFKDRSLVSSNDLYSDNRVRYLEYTPQKYPFTVVYESEVHTNSTVFINPWKPVSRFNVGVERSSYKLKNPSFISIRTEEKNLESFEVEKNISKFEIEYSIKYLPAYKHEAWSPALENFIPQVKIAPEQFSLVGVTGKASNWEEFGKWQYDNLLVGRDQLPQETIEEINKLTSEAETDIEKARIIYQYVQDNTRYISVQLGIGGWEPMTAAEVDRVGYGDCKALTNYTKALLDTQHIPSYYSVVYGGENKKDITADFTSMQGNHVILNLPLEEEEVWLECTSQTTPFNYLGDFTDNRDVLVIKPEGGEIVKTKAYKTSENLQETFSSILLDENGGFSAAFNRKSKGVPYGNSYHLIRQKEKDQVLYYKRNWGHLKKLEIEQLVFNNDRDAQEFVEELKLTGQNFSTKAGGRLLLPLNFLTPSTYEVPRIEERKRPIQLARGRSFKDTFEFVLPEGYQLESLPENVRIENQFGSFELQIEAVEKEGAELIEVQRSYVLNEGTWPAESYNDFRDFMFKIRTLSNQKAVIVGTN